MDNSHDMTNMDAEIARLNALVEQLKDDGINKIMAMTDEQVSALARLEGSNPDDVARLTKKVFDLALANNRITDLEDRLEKAQAELMNIADTKRFNCEMFRDDTEWADWAQSRCRHANALQSIPADTKGNSK